MKKESILDPTLAFYIHIEKANKLGGFFFFIIISVASKSGLQVVSVIYEVICSIGGTVSE